MILHISAKEIELTPDISETVEKKLKLKLEKLLKHYPEESTSAQIVIQKGERWGFKVKAELDIPGENIHAEASHKDLTFALTALTDELTTMLRKKKERALNN